MIKEEIDGKEEIVQEMIRKKEIIEIITTITIITGMPISMQ